MAKKQDDGGKAFPRQLKQVNNPLEFDPSDLAPQTGMTLLDFAAIYATEDDVESVIRTRAYSRASSEDRCRARYDFATTMIAEKRRREQS